MLNNDEILNVINLAKKYPIIIKVGIYGSYARGEQIEASDIDVLFDYDNSDEDFIYDVMKYINEVSDEFKKLNVNTDINSYRGLMGQNNGRLRKNILKDLVWLYEKD